MNKVIQGDCLVEIKNLEDNSKETMARGVIVLNVSEMPQENISVGKGQNYLLVGDNAIWLKKIPDNSIDSIVTDPPAGISFMGRGWDTDKGGRDHWIAWMQEVATECKRVLKPGGHAFVWAIPRTSHWTATAWENAGFEIRDVVAHIFGSGFPKSLNIGKAVDKLQGNERIATGEIKHHAQKGVAVAEERGAIGGGAFGQAKDEEITKGTSEWEGWGTALKPAREDWLLMRKPLAEKTVAENVLKYGTGGINIDESRVGTEERFNAPAGNKAGGNSLNMSAVGMPQDVDGTTAIGRFPANLIHDNSEEVRGCFPETKSGKMGKQHTRHTDGSPNGIYGKFDINHELGETYGDSGNASRFFKSIIYQAKASKSERNKGCEDLAEKQYSHDGREKEIENPYQRNKSVSANNHPTVKPIALMEYLIKMVTPKGGIVLDPFAGSGSTLVAAKQNGFQYIGIEMTAEYIPIIEARLNNLQI